MWLKKDKRRLQWRKYYTTEEKGEGERLDLPVRAKTERGGARPGSTVVVYQVGTYAGC